MRTALRLTAVVLLAVILIAAKTSAQETTDTTENVPEVRALRVNPHAPRIDGNLDDDIWHSPKLEFARDFTQRDPKDGEPASESTLVAIAYGDHSIYVAAWCYDSEPARVGRQLVRRDREAQSDDIVIRFDPYHDHQNGYGFRTTAAGVQSDWRIYNDGWSDMSWDGVWHSAVKIQPWGWSAELEIPYHCLRFEEKDLHVWGMQISRRILRREEYSYWSYWPESEAGFVSRFGHLTGLKDIQPARHLEVMPYGVSSLETEPKHAGNTNGRDYYGNMGADIKYGLATNLTLDAAINPDFGQVELDAPVLNLSAYETWFEEKRPFFLEGSDLFETNYSLFYSRRVGRAPTRDIDDDERIYYTSYPKSTTILGSAKLTGKLAGRTSIALLTAITEEEKAKYAAERLDADTTYVGLDTVVDTTFIDTVFREGIVEPLAGYTVLRVQQDLFKASHAGAMMTIASQDTEYPAVTGGFDWRLNTNNSRWSCDGQLVLSRVDNKDVGFGLDLNLNKDAGNWRGAVGLVNKDVNLNINRLGYTRRNDYRELWGWMQYRTTDDWWVIRNSWNNINAIQAWNYSGQNISRHYNFNNSIQFVNNWYAGCGVGVSMADYDDRETRGQGIWEIPSSWNWWVWAETDMRKSFQAEFDFNYGDSFNNPWWSTQLLLRYRPASSTEFWVSGEFVHDFSQLKWVDNRESDNGADTVVFADKDQDIIEMDLGAAVTFSPTLSFQISAEGLLSGLDYRNARPYIGNAKYGALLAADDFDQRYDYNYSAINSTAILRWEYIPGSTIYAVWTRSLTEVDDTVNKLEFGRDFSRLISAGAQNVFLIKINYWMNI